MGFFKLIYLKCSIMPKWNKMYFILFLKNINMSGLFGTALPYFVVLLVGVICQQYLPQASVGFVPEVLTYQDFDPLPLILDCSYMVPSSEG